eukprot:gnl/Ergobibamus_cyprinoides/5024.p1 GENE.gnl/Ergobibamus_cyprinoides/5024~~gnl/Ergobibamus_cyprinoides/5024.p1  ORF type:complete len:145 (-),score=39.52 gnl/Ergobibamus_cyprinoides/5024:38-472(-)
MVSFVCDVCGATLKKKQLATHHHHGEVFSCVDCGLTFSAETAHQQCMTEAERFHGKFAKAAKVAIPAQASEPPKRRAAPKATAETPIPVSSEFWELLLAHLTADGAQSRSDLPKQAAKAIRKLGKDKDGIKAAVRSVLRTSVPG